MLSFYLPEMKEVRDSQHSLSSSPALCWSFVSLYEANNDNYNIYTNPGLVVKKDCVKPTFKQTLVVDVGEKDGVCCVFILGKGVVPVLGLGTIALVMEGFWGARFYKKKDFWRSNLGLWYWCNQDSQNDTFVWRMDHGVGGATVLLSKSRLAMLIAAAKIVHGWWWGCQFWSCSYWECQICIKWKWIWVKNWGLIFR